MATSQKKTGGRTTPKKTTPEPQGVTTVQEWKQSSTAKAHELKLPSGKVCLVRRAGIEMFLKQGEVPNPLMEKVGQLITKAQELGKAGAPGPGVKDEDLDAFTKSIMENPSQINDLFDMVDMATVQIVVEPKVSPVADRLAIEADESLSDHEKREKIDSQLWVDEVDLEDKMFIFQYAVGGSKDIERFRLETGQHLVSR